MLLCILVCFHFGVQSDLNSLGFNHFLILCLRWDFVQYE